jgi:uncharacterized protein (TIGR03083 family)
MPEMRPNSHPAAIAPFLTGSIGIHHAREETMASTQDQQAAVSQAQWDATNPASKENLLRVVRDEAERMFALAEVPENWEKPTASGHWQVRDIIGHMVDVTEGYLDAFRICRAGEEAEPPVGLLAMAQRLDERAQALRSVPQAELMKRLRDDFAQMMEVFAGLTSEDWTGLMVPHGYMGPVPAFFYPTFHLVDYGVHGWDIREGLGLTTGLSGDTADFLAPIMFILWQATTVPDRIGGEPLRAGVRVSGRNAGTWHVTVSDSGYVYERVADDTAELPVMFEFDPGSLVLTAYGRINGGTAYGDTALADRYRSLFHSI